MNSRVVHTIVDPTDRSGIIVSCNEQGMMMLIVRHGDTTVTIELGRIHATELTAVLARYWRPEGFDFGGGIGQ